MPIAEERAKYAVRAAPSIRGAPWAMQPGEGVGLDAVIACHSPQISHVFYMVRTGFKLVADPFSFVVHRPHPPSAGYNHTFTGPAYTRAHRSTEVGRRGRGRGLGLPTAHASARPPAVTSLPHPHNHTRSHSYPYTHLSLSLRNQTMKKLNVLGAELLEDVKSGVYPEHGVTTLAACRPLTRWFDVQHEALGGRGRTGGRAARAWEEASRLAFMRGGLQNPVVAWW